MNIPIHFCHRFVILICDNQGKAIIVLWKTRGRFVMRIRVIEDNHRLNSSLASSLAQEGYSVDSAYDGQEGQDLAELTVYDLIILDLLLPEKDGLEVCRDLRLRPLLRRHQPDKTGRLTLEDLVIDPVAHSVERGERPIDLTPKEFALLEYLMYHPNQAVTREMIEQHIWNYDFECESNVIDVYVRRLRRKIDAPFAVKLLTTVRGVGYRLQPPTEQG